MDKKRNIVRRPLLKSVGAIFVFASAGLLLNLSGCWMNETPPVEKVSGLKVSDLKTPSVAIQLPDQYNSPDGMALAPDGNIYLSMPNLGNSEYPAKILRMTPEDKLEEVVTLPLHPELKTVVPLGLAVGPNGHLYVADCQAFSDDSGKSRVLRVRMEGLRAVGVEVVVEGLVMANAVSCHGEHLFVTDTTVDKSADPVVSGVYRFRLADLSSEKPIHVSGSDDPHLIATLETHSKEHPLGANGLAFDSKGRMYVCNFGDRSVIRFAFDQAGDVQTPEVLAQDSGMQSTDGMLITADDRIFVADFLGNAIHHIDIDTGEVQTIAKNEQTDGTGGLLDGPSEVCVRGKRMYVSNIDLTYGDNQFDEVHTISAIELD